VGDSAAIHDLLRLTLVPELGPVRIARLLEHFGDVSHILRAAPADLARVKGLGDTLSRRVAEALRDSNKLLEEELTLAAKLGVRVIAKGREPYPELLAQLPDAPPILYIQGELRPASDDKFPMAIVGSRDCTHYGMEQGERFASLLAASGVTILSGGARGIDTAAHRGALRAGGRTIAVLGCGLARAYPPENEPLFAEIARHGAVVSELPLNTAPDSKNFPARNRIISGLSLGVLVIEAGHKSGSLITAKIAAEDHGREVMALPGRVDSPASRGSLELIKSGGAHLVTEPGDCLALLEVPARHLHSGTHADRYPQNTAASAVGTQSETQRGSNSGGVPPGPLFANLGTSPPEISGVASAIVRCLAEPMTLDELARAMNLPIPTLRAELTQLEIQRRIVRDGPLLRTRKA
jgi:DNA processing protein